MRDGMKQLKIEEFKKGGSRKFFEIIKGELADIPVAVSINIKGKQKDMERTADAFNNIIRSIIANPQAFSQIPGIGKAVNEMLENSGLSPMDFTEITKVTQQMKQPQEQSLSTAQPVPQVV
jgi:hypothetical protein